MNGNGDGQGTVGEIFGAFLKLGLTSFGGPVAHLGFFQKELVERRNWVSEAGYADVVALCQFLPGPTSSQVGFALGYLRGGWAGALAAFLAFTAPSALIMMGCAFGLVALEVDAAWLHGLKLAAVAVVAQAVWGMAIKLCPDRGRVTLAFGATTAVLLLGTAWIQVVVIAGGLLLGGLFFRRWAGPSPSSAEQTSARIPPGILSSGSLVLFAVLLVALPMAATIWPDRWMATFDAFYRTGSLVFGGGHVVLPLLEAETVGRGWMTQSEFLAGYGAAQALPGPLFSLAAFLGTVIGHDGPGGAMGFWCLAAIFLPGFLLVIGLLPHWARLRDQAGARSALAGANAAVVGILLAALYDPVFISAVDGPPALVIGLMAFGALQFWRLPPWLVVIGCAALGGLFLPAPS